jgi:phage gp36-like protein
VALIVKADLVNALSPTTVNAIFDDNRDGTADDAPIVDVCARAEAQVMSYLHGVYTVGTIPTTDVLLRAAAVDFAVAYAFERHPEYVRTFGEQPRAERWKRATETMARIQAGIQRPTETNAVQTPKNIGGVIIDRGPRMFVHSSDGTANSGDF